MLSLLAQWDDIKVPREGDMEGRGQECAEGRGQGLSRVSKLEQCVARVMGWTADERYVSACPVPPRWHLVRVPPTLRPYPSLDTVQRVWRSMRTLFLPRYQLELVGLLQQVTASCHRALAQVSNMYVCLSAHLHHD